MRKEKHKSVNIFSNFNISKETSDGKIGHTLSKSNDSKRIKKPTISDVSQNANAFFFVHEYI